MIQNNVKKFKPILELSLAQQNIFDLLNNFLRNQLIKAASVTDFSSTRVKNGMFEKYCCKTSLVPTSLSIGGYYLYQLTMFRGIGQSQIAFSYSDTECLKKSSFVRN